VTQLVTSQLKAVVEQVKSKNKFSVEFVPHPSLMVLVCRWARQPPCNFAADSLNSCFVAAREKGLDSAFQLCDLRGWIVTLPTLRPTAKSRAPFNLEHKRRFHECLKNAKFSPGHRGLHLLGIVKAAHDTLETSVLPPTGQSVVASPKKRKLGNKDDQNPNHA
jgi:hypothetical protein